MVEIHKTEKAKNILKELDNIDKKLKELNSVLASNNIDKDTPLIDDEGFPIEDIDIVTVRKVRNTIICLQNDREKLLAEMSEALSKLHQSNKSDSNPSSEILANIVHRTSNKPFAKILSIEPFSPADKANLKKNDLIIQFGTLHAENFEGFEQLKKFVLDSINNVIKVTVFREDINSPIHVHRLEITPQKWEGEGILGCKFGPSD